MGGQLPHTSAELMRLLPGVGRYTACMHPSTHTHTHTHTLLSHSLSLSHGVVCVCVCRCYCLNSIWGGVWSGRWERGEGVVSSQDNRSRLLLLSSHEPLLVSAPLIRTPLQDTLSGHLPDQDTQCYAFSLGGSLWRQWLERCRGTSTRL